MNLTLGFSIWEASREEDMNKANIVLNWYASCLKDTSALGCLKQLDIRCNVNGAMQDSFGCVRHFRTIRRLDAAVAKLQLDTFSITSSFEYNYQDNPMCISHVRMVHDGVRSSFPQTLAKKTQQHKRYAELQYDPVRLPSSFHSLRLIILLLGMENDARLPRLGHDWMVYTRYVLLQVVKLFKTLMEADPRPDSQISFHLYT